MDKDSLKKHPSRILKQIPRQLNFLNNSCESFDEGQREEAVRIAVILRTLFHDTKQSKSLLAILGVKNETEILSTCSPTPVVEKHELFAWDPLTSFDEEKRLTPILSTREKKWFLLAEDWWQNNTVVILVPGICVSRRSIVLAAANKDGGTHVDKYTDEYEYLDRGFWQSGCEWHSEHQFVLLRQFAFEVLNSPNIKNLCEY